MKKKILAVTIAAALIVSCFTSCDNNTSSDSQASKAESSTTVSSDSASSATDISSASDSKTFAAVLTAINSLQRTICSLTVICRAITRNAQI